VVSHVTGAASTVSFSWLLDQVLTNRAALTASTPSVYALGFLAAFSLATTLSIPTGRPRHRPGPQEAGLRSVGGGLMPIAGQWRCPSVLDQDPAGRGRCRSLVIDPRRTEPPLEYAEGTRPVKAVNDEASVTGGSRRLRR
jgi:hypothetical protein